jgi:hypothetical protein
VTPDLYARDGRRFVLYSPAAQHVPPIPVPRPLAPGEPSADEPVVEVRPGQYRMYAARCPHGSFARWASRNCCKPNGARRGR